MMNLRNRISVKKKIITNQFLKNLAQTSVFYIIIIILYPFFSLAENMMISRVICNLLPNSFQMSKTWVWMSPKSLLVAHVKEDTWCLASLILWHPRIAPELNNKK